MKKLFTTWLLLAIAVMGFQAKADLWLIGALSQYGWVPNQGEQFTLVSGNDYTLDLNVTSTGEKYFALTTQLASTADDWDAIKPYRFGGQGYTVTLGQDLTLVAGVDNSPKVTIPAVGVYTIKFNTSTGVINITRKEGDDTPEFVMPDFCTWQEGKNFVYIEDTNNWGASGINVYTWGGYDNGGWPGQANVNATPVGQYNGHNVYLFDAPTAAPTNLIISNNGNNRYTGADLTWKTGGYYNAGGMQGVVEQTTPTEPAWYIAGSFTDWANGKKEMTKGADGSFSITVEGIEDGAEFKFIDQDNKWYGGNTEGAEGNYGVHKDWCTDITLTQGDAGSNFQVTGQGDLTFTIKDGKLSITGWEEAPQPEAALYIAGSFTNWEEGKVAMTKGETAYTYTIEGAKEGDEFKFIDETNTWFGSEAEGENFWLNAEVTEANLVSPGKNFYINGAGDLVVTVDLEKKTVKVTGFEVAPEPEKKLYVLGDFQEWKPNAGQELTYDENTKLFGGKVTLAEEGYIKFATKLQETEEWGDLDEYLIGAVSEGDFVMQEEYLGHKIDIVAKGQAIKLPAGEWTLSVDVENDSLVITGTWPVTPEPEKKFYIAGSFTDPQWEEGKLEMTEGEDGAFSIEVKGVKAGDQFKFIDQDNVWYGGNTEGAEGNYGVHPEWCTDIELTAGDSGSNFEIVNDAKGDLTFTIKDGKLTITGWDETPVEPAKLYVLGDFQEWKPNAGQEMTYNEETKVYTVELTTEAEGCIKFTTQLSETEEWTIDEYLWGAESEGDFVLTDELVGQELTLKAKGEAFKIAAGKWAITADLENGKVIFAKAGDPVVRGDVNGDGVVSGADVTALYNNLLDETPVNGDPDVNGDGVVSGADVTALYGILMEAE